MLQTIFLLTFLCFGVSARTIEQVVVTVDDSFILQTELKKYERFLSSPLFHSSKLLDLYSKRSLRKNKSKLLKYLIDVKILSLNLPLEQLEKTSKKQLLQQELSRKKINIKKARRYLKKISMSLSEYQDVLYYNHLIDNWLQAEVISSIQISDESLNDYYLRKKGKNFFTKKKYVLNRWAFESLNQAQIFLKKEDKSQNSAREISFTREQMNRPLRKAILKMNVGQFSSPVCLGSNCFVFELLHKNFVAPKTQNSEKIRREIAFQTFKEKLKQWMEEKRKISIVKTYL